MVIDCLSEKLLQFKDAQRLIKENPDKVKLKAESGRLSKNRVEEAERMVRTLESNLPEVKKLMDDFGRIHGDERLASSLEAAKYAHETLQRRYGFKIKNVIQAKEKADSAAKMMTDVLKDHNISLIDSVQSLHHSDFGLAVKGYLPDSTSFSGRLDSYKSLYGAQISDVLEELVPAFSFGKRDDAIGREFMRAYEYVTKGTRTGEFSERMVALAERAEKWSLNQAKDLERAGVDLKGRRAYLMGAFSDVEKLRKVSQKDYVDWMMTHEDSIDWENVRALAPGAADTPEQRRAFLEHFYQSKVSNGAIKPGNYLPFRQNGVATVVNSRGEHRLLQFKTADAATGYNEQFGHGGVFETMMYLNDRHARHMALTETYSPTPGAFVSELKNTLVRKYGLDALDAVEKVLDNVKEASKVDYRNIVGPKTKAAFDGVTNGFRASVLGSAFIPSYFQDASNVAIGKAMRGWPWMADYVKTLFKIFDPNLKEDMAELAHMGYSMAVYNDAMMNSDRASHLHWSERYAKKALTATMKVSLLERQTIAQKAVNIMSAGKYLADWLDGRAVSPRLSSYLQSAGISDEATKSILREAINEPGMGGHKFRMVDLNKLFESGDPAKMEAATRLSSLMEDMSEISAPVASSKAGQFWQKASQSSGLGYIGTKLAQPLTSYMTSHWQNILQPILKQEGMNRVQLLAAYTIAGAVTGSMLVQIQRLLTGKEPLPLGPELAARAAMQFSLGPLLGTLANLGSSGPVFEDSLALLRAAKQMATLPVHAVKSAVTGKEYKQLGKDTVASLKLLTPGQNLWQTKLLMERYVWDQLEKSVDGANFRQRVSKRIKAEKKKGSGFYWKPGETSPR